MARSLNTIAHEIRNDWKKVSPYAIDYLDAMETLDSIDDKYIADSGRSIVAYFLSNAQSWKGETAKRIKKELNQMLKEAELVILSPAESITEKIEDDLDEFNSYWDGDFVVCNGSREDLLDTQEYLKRHNIKFELRESIDLFSNVLDYETFTLYESINETYGLEVKVIEDETAEDKITITINGGKYSYVDSGKGKDGKGNDIPFSEVVRKFRKMMTFSEGRALQYLLKNTKMVTKKKEKEAPAEVSESNRRRLSK
jgi:hypothetical protein